MGGGAKIVIAFNEDKYYLHYMLNGTTLSAIRVLVYLARQNPSGVESHRKIAEQLGESQTYMAKVTGLLVKGAILRAEKGVRGGVRLIRPPAQITLLAVAQACQGTIVGDFCLPGRDPDTTCGFHHAAEELHNSIVSVLSKWSIARIMEPPRGRRDSTSCVIFCNKRSKAGAETRVQIGVPMG